MTKTLDFTSKMNRLKEIVSILEDGKIKIDDSIKLYEEGLKLTKDLQTELKTFEDKVEKISKEK